MNFKSISKRTLAYMTLKVSGTLGGGFVVGVEVWQAAAVAAFVGFMEVAEEVSRAMSRTGMSQKLSLMKSSVDSLPMTKTQS